MKYSYFIAFTYQKDGLKVPLLVTFVKTFWHSAQLAFGMNIIKSNSPVSIDRKNYNLFRLQDKKTQSLGLASAFMLVPSTHTCMLLVDEMSDWYVFSLYLFCTLSSCSDKTKAWHIYRPSIV